MGKALFLGLSAAFFTAYSLIATAVVNPSGRITPISGPESRCTSESGIILPGDPCYNAEINNFSDGGDPLWNFFKGVSDIIEVATNLFSGFGQLITFNAGLPAASFITLLIFVPLGFVNAYIVFSAIRGNS